MQESNPTLSAIQFEAPDADASSSWESGGPKPTLFRPLNKPLIGAAFGASIDAHYTRQHVFVPFQAPLRNDNKANGKWYSSMYGGRCGSSLKLGYFTDDPVAEGPSKDHNGSHRIQ